MPTPLMRLPKSHVGNSTSPTETLEDHLQAEGAEDTHRTPQDHPQAEGAVEVEVAAVEERSHYPGTRRPNPLKSS